MRRKAAETQLWSHVSPACPGQIVDALIDDGQRWAAYFFPVATFMSHKLDPVCISMHEVLHRSAGCCCTPTILSSSPVAGAQGCICTIQLYCRCVQTITMCFAEAVCRGQGKSAMGLRCRSWRDSFNSRACLLLQVLCALQLNLCVHRPLAAWQMDMKRQKASLSRQLMLSLRQAHGACSPECMMTFLV